jgi:hypothetical protein
VNEGNRPWRNAPGAWQPYNIKPPSPALSSLFKTFLLPARKKKEKKITTASNQHTTQRIKRERNNSKWMS